jgi:nitroreductase
MDVITAINTRYSCRAYLDKPVPKALLEQVIDAGRRAPTARRVQPVIFVVATDPTLRSRLAELLEFGRFMAQASACIAVYAHPTKYYLEDGCAAVENILLAATSLGLQSCWVAGDKKEHAPAVSELLGVPAEEKLIALLAIGYARDPGRQPDRKPLEQVLYWEKYQASA